MNEFLCIAIIRDVMPEDIEDVINALMEEGIDQVEISLSNTNIGYASISRAVKSFKGKIKIGAGTVTKENQISELKKIGVDFIITPAYDDVLVDKAIEEKVEIIPGVFSPKDVMSALNKNIKKLKLFPFDILGTSYIKSLKGPFPETDFYAVGGVNLSNIEEIYKAGFIGIAPGSDLVKRGSTKKDIVEIRNKAKMYFSEVRRCTHRN